jgi:hypothetical protein
MAIPLIPHKRRGVIIENLRWQEISFAGSNYFEKNNLRLI